MSGVKGLNTGLMQPSQNGLAAGSTNHLLWEFVRLLAVRKCIIFTNNKDAQKVATASNLKPPPQKHFEKAVMNSNAFLLRS